MAAISGVAWKTAQPFPQKHALRVRPHSNPHPEGEGGASSGYSSSVVQAIRQLLLQKVMLL